MQVGAQSGLSLRCCLNAHLCSHSLVNNCVKVTMLGVTTFSMFLSQVVAFFSLMFLNKFI